MIVPEAAEGVDRKVSKRNDKKGVFEGSNDEECQTIVSEAEDRSGEAFVLQEPTNRLRLVRNPQSTKQRSMVHRQILYCQTMKILDVEDVAEKGWKMFEKPKKEGGTFHFASLTDVCRVRQAELAKHLQTYRERVVLRGDIVQDYLPEARRFAFLLAAVTFVGHDCSITEHVR